MTAARHRGWLAFGLLGLVTAVLAWTQIARAITGGYLFAYAPLGHLQVVVAVLALVPCLALRGSFQARLLPPSIWPAWTARTLAARALACFVIAFAIIVASVPGMLATDPRRALAALVVMLGLQHVAQWRLVGAAHAFRATWLAVSLAAISPTIANTVFDLIVG